MAGEIPFADLTWVEAAYPPFNEMLPLYGPVILDRLVATFAGDPVGFEAITVDATVKQLAPPGQATSAMFTVETASVRLRTDGADPATGVGLLFVAGTAVTLTGLRTLQSVRFVRATGVSGIINVAYFD